MFLTIVFHTIYIYTLNTSAFDFFTYTIKIKGRSGFTSG